MGGKSRKTGAVSKSLIDRIRAGGKISTGTPKKQSPAKPNAFGLSLQKK